MTDPTITVLAPPVDGEEWQIREFNRSIGERIQEGTKRLSERVPIRYADAVVSVPKVREWVTGLVNRTMDELTHWHITPCIKSGPSLVILGPTGTGKTFEAWGAVRALAASGAGFSWSVTSAADMYAALRPRHRVDAEEEFERYARAGLLVIDDLGAAKTSDWVEEINYRLINYRYEHNRPTLITSNVPARDLAEALGDRVTSRLIEMADRVVLDGKDRRRETAA